MLKCLRCGNNDLFERTTRGYEEYSKDRGIFHEAITLRGKWTCGRCQSKRVEGAPKAPDFTHLGRTKRGMFAVADEIPDDIDI